MSREERRGEEKREGGEDGRDREREGGRGRGEREEQMITETERDKRE